MKHELIAPYESKIGCYVGLSEYTSTSRSPLVAFGFALNKEKAEHVPVLFVILCRNYYSPFGIQLNNSAYSAYLDEGEFLLMEGCIVYIMAVEHDFQITNTNAHVRQYNSKTITVVHMYHS